MTLNISMLKTSWPFKGLMMKYLEHQYFISEVCGLIEGLGDLMSD